MPRHVLIDELHLSLLVPINLKPAEQRAIRRILTGAGFRARLYRTVRTLMRRFSALDRVRLTISR